VTQLADDFVATFLECIADVDGMESSELVGLNTLGV
jgi:hypothetical protein